MISITKPQPPFFGAFVLLIPCCLLTPGDVFGWPTLAFFNLTSFFGVQTLHFWKAFGQGRHAVLHILEGLLVDLSMAGTVDVKWRCLVGEPLNQSDTLHDTAWSYPGLWKTIPTHIHSSSQCFWKWNIVNCKPQKDGNVTMCLQDNTKMYRPSMSRFNFSTWELLHRTKKKNIGISHDLKSAPNDHDGHIVSCPSNDNSCDKPSIGAEPWCRARHGWNPAALSSSGRPSCVASPSSSRTQRIWRAH